jgi:hypothetical protein
MTRLLSIGAVLSVMIVGSSACQRSEGPAVQNTPQTATTPARQRDEVEWRIDESKVLLAGTFNRETKVLQISKGLPEPCTFENFDSAFLTLAQAGYQQAGLPRLRTILINEKDIDDEDLSAIKIAPREDRLGIDHSPPVENVASLVNGFLIHVVVSHRHLHVTVA